MLFSFFVWINVFELFLIKVYGVWLFCKIFGDLIFKLKVIFKIKLLVIFKFFGNLRFNLLLFVWVVVNFLLLIGLLLV